MESKWLSDLNEYSRHFNEPECFQAGRLSWLATKLRYESQHNDDFSGLTIEGLMLELGAEIARFSHKVARRPVRWLDQIRDLLNENFAQHVSLAELAAVAGVHPVYLATMFRENFHCTVGDYVRRLRVDFASRELSSTDTPLAEIALAAGFAHQSHFARTFKRLTGLTPRQYRSAAR